jgi:hypothetical protein
VQGVGDPVQVVGPADHEQPDSELHVLCVVFAVQGVTVPVHVELQEQPYSALQEVDVVFELHGVIVPVHGALQVQPDWEEHVVCVVKELQAVRVPLHGTVQVQPPFEQRLEDWYVEQSDGVPEHVFVLESQLHPALRQSTL